MISPADVVARAQIDERHRVAARSRRAHSVPSTRRRLLTRLVRHS